MPPAPGVACADRLGAAQGPEGVATLSDVANKALGWEQAARVAEERIAADGLAGLAGRS